MKSNDEKPSTRPIENNPMSNVKSLDPNGIEDILRHFQNANDLGKLKGIVVLSLNKDQTQFMMASNLSMHEKVFLHGFFGSWITKWFRANEVL